MLCTCALCESLNPPPPLLLRPLWFSIVEWLQSGNVVVMHTPTNPNQPNASSVLVKLAFVLTTCALLRAIICFILHSWVICVQLSYVCTFMQLCVVCIKYALLTSPPPQLTHLSSFKSTSILSPLPSPPHRPTLRSKADSTLSRQ